MSLEFHTNEELLNELFSRESFKAIVLQKSGEKNNAQDGTGGCEVRISKGMMLLDIFNYIDGTLDSLKQKFPAAYNKYYGE